MRPADALFGEDETLWLARAQEAVSLGPLGHHAHWTAPDHARPSNGDTGERVLAEGARMRELGLVPTLFCGGGWYTDVEVADACATLGYVDSTSRARRPPYLGENERWASLDTPSVVKLPSGRTLAAIPTTHSLGDLARGLPRRDLPRLVHVYFHDTDLLDAWRRALLRVVLPALARRARVTDLDALAARALESAPRVVWDDVARL